MEGAVGSGVAGEAGASLGALAAPVVEAVGAVAVAVAPAITVPWGVAAGARPTMLPNPTSTIMVAANTNPPSTICRTTDVLSIRAPA
jgi:hypothetical protein